jgi:alpha-glucosidase (family GH31 glycosyl hydrolase)
MDYEFSPFPALIMRSIGGIFDFYVFSGPEPESITQQFTSLVGRPFHIPYFSLGFQLARWNYKNLDDMKRVVESNIAAGIPLDVQYADFEHFKDNMDFTIDEQKFKDLPKYFKDLQSRGMRVTIILDPALVVSRGSTGYKPYIDGFNNNVFIKWPTGMSPDYSDTNSDVMLGYCWPNDKVAYPDFMNERTKTWWMDQIVNYRKVNISFDGLWIDMYEPVNNYF